MRAELQYCCNNQLLHLLHVVAVDRRCCLSQLAGVRFPG